MRSWFERVTQNFSGFMNGRYGQKGQDKLTRYLWISALVFWGVSLFVPISLLTTLMLMHLILSLFRTFSRNIDAREKEQELFTKLVKWPKEFVKLLKLRVKQGKTHKFFRCECGVVLKVPKGCGKIEVTCPKCKLHTFRNT